MQEIFGPGIRDVAVDSAEWGGWLKHTPLIHTHYWKKETEPQKKLAWPKAWAVNMVREALDLDSRTWLEPKPAPPARAAGAGQNAD